ncbi:ADP-ribosylglycohydrolase family protein [Paraburkholderia atlantica]|uniref:ADP-ribosylglycohydrolase family protein n=1 Tax=Paraburkholderia atlantica TaxID=2654982 RepID=UPI00161C5CCB|nr:ADP-ribosylglycohydrolase family protein [Paraburkholderia atlantica]MBB5417079.1 ADP-ribosylglycohydrolase [Paraburkholderia atlantica]
MTNHTEAQICRSALWAAYGDAVGFPTELISKAQFQRRTGRDAMQGTIAWRRRVGGMFGPDVEFPVGAYSDDTQLRLSTSRSIRGDGYFDVESFAKIELPVWLNYALGAGRGSKLAAANLALRESTWSQNFYKSAQSAYWQGGGNGAAMRIQPHVWAAKNLSDSRFIANVVRDTICTHGHPRAIAGAAIHALLLAYVLDSGTIPSPGQWAQFSEACDIAFASLTGDDELSFVWVPNWERLTGQSLAQAFADVKREWIESAQHAAKFFTSHGDDYKKYHIVLEELGGYNPAERGSGLKTPLFALLLAWITKDAPPEQGLLLSANTFGSDTDTIGTMAGALLGAVADTEPEEHIQDADYIRSEASRLFRISKGKKERSFEYPDILKWTAPRAQRDAWLVTDEGPALAALGPVEPFGEIYSPEKGTDMSWQWCRTSFGQTLLAKRKPAKEVRESTPPSRTALAAPASETKQHEPQRRGTDDAKDSIDALTQRCINSGFDAALVGETLLRLSSGEYGVEHAVAFAAIIAKAKLARSRK